MAEQNEKFRNKFYRDFGLTKVPKEWLDKQELYNLFKKPTKDNKLSTPIFYNFEKNDTHQADILYLPDDDGYKYCLVITDVATSKTDAEPLKEISSKTTLEAMKKIYNRNILKMPDKMITDAGKEFKGDFHKYLTDNNISHKTALPGRHRQVAMVERKNQIIGKVLLMRQFAQELLTGQVNKNWKEDLPIVIQKMNKRYSHNPLTETQVLKKSKNPVKNLKQDILPLGTEVRIMLDEPVNIADEKQFGKFRTADHRWTQMKYKIINYIIDPFQPLLYIVDRPLKEGERVAYTRNQLQVVSPDEEDPDRKVLRGNSDTYMVKKIIGDRKVGRKQEYLVWYKGYKKDEAEWTPANNVPKISIDIYNRTK